MAKLKIPSLANKRYYFINSGDLFPEIIGDMIFYINDAATYDLSLRRGSNGNRLIIKNDSAGVVYIKLTNDLTLSIASNEYKEVLWDKTQWIRMVDVDIPASTILEKLLTVDGTNSGLDADVIRGTIPGAGGLTLLGLSSLGTEWTTLLSSSALTLMKSTLDASTYYGLTDPSGSSVNWIRTTSKGLIPYTSGGASALGTSSWPFSYAYINTMYGNASSADKLSTARKINGVDFDGTADISISVSTSWADISGKPSLFTGVIDVNGFYCLTDPNGSSTNYIRTTSYGLIPHTSGGSGTLGTPSWPFSAIYANNLYGNLNGGTTAPTVLVLPTATSTANGAIWIS